MFQALKPIKVSSHVPSHAFIADVYSVSKKVKVCNSFVLSGPAGGTLITIILTYMNSVSRKVWGGLNFFYNLICIVVKISLLQIGHSLILAAHSLQQMQCPHVMKAASICFSVQILHFWELSQSLTVFLRFLTSLACLSVNKEICLSLSVSFCFNLQICNFKVLTTISWHLNLCNCSFKRISAWQKLKCISKVMMLLNFSVQCVQGNRTETLELRVWFSFFPILISGMWTSFWWSRNTVLLPNWRWHSEQKLFFLLERLTFIFSFLSHLIKLILGFIVPFYLNLLSAHVWE